MGPRESPCRRGASGACEEWLPRQMLPLEMGDPPESCLPREHCWHGPLEWGQDPRCGSRPLGMSSLAGQGEAGVS